METSAGLCIIFRNRILLVHPAGYPNAKWGFPKGHAEAGESLKDAALREVQEEVGIEIPKHLIKHEPIAIPMFSKKGKKVWKMVYIFAIRIPSLRSIGLSTLEVPSSMLQREEIDEARFMDYSECIDLLHPRYHNFLKLLN